MALKPPVLPTDPEIWSILAVPSYGAMALKHAVTAGRSNNLGLAVPSYGAMALKHGRENRNENWSHLAVPSYGAMALKPRPDRAVP